MSGHFRQQDLSKIETRCDGEDIWVCARYSSFTKVMKNILHRLQQRPHLSLSVKPHLLHFQFQNRRKILAISKKKTFYEKQLQNLLFMVYELDIIVI